MMKYFYGFLQALGFAAIICLALTIMITPFFLIGMYLSHTTLGIYLMLGWLVIVFAAIFSPLFVKD